MDKSITGRDFVIPVVVKLPGKIGDLPTTVSNVEIVLTRPGDQGTVSVWDCKGGIDGFFI